MENSNLRLRVTPELKNAIEESADKNNRSQSAEMISRLEQSFELEKTFAQQSPIAPMNNSFEVIQKLQVLGMFANSNLCIHESSFKDMVEVKASQLIEQL